MVSRFPITLRRPRCGQCGHSCPRIHFTRTCRLEQREFVLHLCSRSCVNSLHRVRCYGCRGLGLTLYKLSKHRRFCLPDSKQQRSCLALLCRSVSDSDEEHCETIFSPQVSDYGSVLLAY